MINNPVSNSNKSAYSLSIQLSLNGFSFCILLPDTGAIVTSYSESSSNYSYTEQQLLQKLKKAFSTKPELQTTFSTIRIIYYNELFTLVPKPLFDQSELSTYINYSVKTLATDYITFDYLKAGIVNVFIPYVNVNNFLLEQLGEFNFVHSSGVLINYVLEKEKHAITEKVSIYFSKKQFDIIITKGENLLLFNSFIYESNEDVLYYLLFCLEQLNLSPNTVQIELLNKVTSTLFELLYTYVRNISEPKETTDILLHQLV